MNVSNLVATGFLSPSSSLSKRQRYKDLAGNIVGLDRA